jgi:hypothetical protein
MSATPWDEGCMQVLQAKIFHVVLIVKCIFACRKQPKGVEIR